MSGIATETNKYQKAVGEYKAKIVDTRKTTPGFRALKNILLRLVEAACIVLISQIVR